MKDRMNEGVSRFDVFLNGAFFVGCALQGDRILAEGIWLAQAKVSKILESCEPGSWSAPTVTSNDGRWFSNQEAYTSLVPFFFMRYQGQAATSVVEKRIGLLASQPGLVGAKVSVGAVTIDFYESGAAVLAIRLSIAMADPRPLSAVRSIVEEIVESLVPPCNRAIGRVSDAFLAGCREALPTHIVETPWYQETRATSERPLAPTAAATGAVGRRKLLWLHATYIFDGRDRSAEFGVRCRDLIPSIIMETIEIRGGDTFIPGLGASVIIDNQHRLASPGPVSQRIILDLMNLQWATIAVAMEADRTLFSRANAFSATGQRAPAAVLEAEARSVLGLHDRARSFRASVDTVLIDLGASAKSVWDAMARVQGLSHVFESIKDKLEGLHQACQSQLAVAAAKRQRRLGVAVDLFAIFGVVASVAAIASFILDSQLESGASFRAAVVGCALGLVVVVAAVSRLGGGRR